MNFKREYPVLQVGDKSTPKYVNNLNIYLKYSTFSKIFNIFAE